MIGAPEINSNKDYSIFEEGFLGRASVAGARRP
jgi:hypothetical protein